MGINSQDSWLVHPCAQELYETAFTKRKKTPTFRDLLYNLIMGTAILLAINVKNLTNKPSGPADIVNENTI